MKNENLRPSVSEYLSDYASLLRYFAHAMILTFFDKPGKWEIRALGDAGKHRCLYFGPRKPPELGKSPGKALAGFKKVSNELEQTRDDRVRLDQDKESMPETLYDSADSEKDLMKDTEVTSRR